MSLARLRTHLGTICTVLVALVVGLAMGEVMVRIVAPQKLSGSWFVVGPQGILMNKASGFARDELTRTRTATYEFNSWGQRGREEPDPAAARVLVLGDSFTFGLGLALDDSYVGILQKRFDTLGSKPRVQLLNAATGGWGTADQLAYLEAFGPALNPSAVVVFVNAWDVERTRDLDIYRVAEDKKGLTVHPVPESRLTIRLLVENNRVLSYLINHSHLFQLVRRAAITRLALMREAAAPPVPRDQGGWQKEETLQFELIMRRMAAWCADHGAQFTVLTTGWPEIDYPWLDSMMLEAGIFFRPLEHWVAGPVAADRDRYTIAGDSHPSEAAAEIIAAAAWPVLEERLHGLEARPLRGRD